MSAEDFHQLAAQEAALARAAATNESRAQHYAMAAYYTRLAEAKEKIAATLEVMGAVHSIKSGKNLLEHPVSASD